MRFNIPGAFDFRRRLVLIVLVLGGVLQLPAAEVFRDGFEAGALSTFWTSHTTNTGRVAVSTTNTPITGQGQLILDDSVDDATYSVAEVVLHLDLTHKKNVVLSFNARSLGNDPNPPYTTISYGTGQAWDAVSISADGGQTWYMVQSLAYVPTTTQSYSVGLDSGVSALYNYYGANFLIRFTEYANSPAPLDGMAIDDVVVTADNDVRSYFDLTYVSTVNEGSTANQGHLTLNFAQAAPLTLSLSASPAGVLILPATVTVPAGQTSAPFTFGTVDDNLITYQQTITISASAPNVISYSSSITVNDNEPPPVATLTIPAQLAEGAPPAVNNATLSIDRVAAVPTIFTLGATPSYELVYPQNVTIPAGQTTVSVSVNAYDDNKLDGNVQVTLSAYGQTATVTAVTTTIDNDIKGMSLVLPTTISEAGTATGTLVLSGTLATNLVVNLASANTGLLTVPATVTVLAGSTQATFTMTAPDNTVRNGTQVVSVSATTTGFPSAAQTIAVRDNEPAGYRFSTLPELVNISSSFTITVTAVDIEGNTIAAPASTVNLSVVLPTGATQALTPATAALGAGGWTGAVTLPSVGAGPLKLRAQDAAGNVGDSNAFSFMRVLPLAVSDLVWDATRSRIYASVPASTTGTYSNKVLAIDPATLQVVASVTAGQNPIKLALTSGGEALYVAQDANGTILKIDPGAMTVSSTFAVGTSSYYGTLYAMDMTTVAGLPNTLVVSQYRKSVSPAFNGVAAYDNGVMRAGVVSYPNCDSIKPSADPAIFFGYNSEDTGFDFTELRLDAGGMSKVQGSAGLLSGFTTGIHSSGNKVFSDSGVALDGPGMARLGTFTLPNGAATMVPDAGSNRAFFIEPVTAYASSYDKIAAFDLNTFAQLNVVSLPTAFTSPGSFIRWGANGLAFKTATSVVFINDGLLVPSDPPADLAVTVQAAPNPAIVAAPLTYTVQVANQGPNTAHNVVLNALLSTGQTLQSSAASTGTATTSASTVSLPVGDLAMGATATLTLVALPQSAGSATCTAGANSSAVDPDFSNNSAVKFVSVGFHAALNTVNVLRLTANNLVYDSTRGLFWATIPSSVAAPLGRSLISIDPLTGLVSTPLALGFNPYPNSIALSANGRYLYFGLTDDPEVVRFDLSTTPPTSTRIPLGLSQWNDPNFAQDIEVLDGDGTSFLISGADDHAAAVYDGAVRRTNRTGIYTIDRIERTATAGVFVGYDNYDSGFGLATLTVTASGVTATRTVQNLISGYYVDIRSSGNLLLSSTGRLVDSGALTLTANLGVSGRPCVDAANQRAYVVAGNQLLAFNTTTFASAGTLALPVTSTGDWAQSCVRWGADGFGILGGDGNIYIARWGLANPTDTNANGIPDTWETDNFHSLAADMNADADGDGISNAMEYLFGTSPSSPSGNPLHIKLGTGGLGMLVQAQGLVSQSVRLAFPRRVGLPAGFYRFDSTTDLQTWSPVQGVSETVVSTATVGGVAIENVEAVVPLPAGGKGFVRMVTTGP